MRKHDSDAALAESDVDADPIVQFGRWFDDAAQHGLLMPEAMTLATATVDGRPSARMVLLRGYDQRGFVFYTNYDSRKGAELASNPAAALVFWWGELERQVRVEGRVERTSREESEAYFRTRPVGSRLGAWASAQSRVIPGRSVVDQRFAELAASHPGGDVPLPPFWGGFRLDPEVVELWQGRPNRLHDRLRYTRAAGRWRIERLAP
jgi:pyridoxamine 5'-phosphate oxidase